MGEYDHFSSPTPTPDGGRAGRLVGRATVPLHDTHCRNWRLYDTGFVLNPMFTFNDGIESVLLHFKMIKDIEDRISRMTSK